jgi:transcriptional regulator with XRE-family HTH domain
MSDPDPSDTSPALAPRLRQLRQKRGLTQAQLATAVGVSRSAVAQWESGRAGQASLHLRRLADALGVQVDDLMPGEQHAIEMVAQAGDERALLRLYRACSATDRQILLLIARRLGSLAVSSS